MNHIIPPKAKKIPHELSKHDHVRQDPWFWLNERKNPEVKAYLEEENAYTAQEMAHLDGLEKSLFLEMKSRIKEDDTSVPIKKDGYYYYVQEKKGMEYPIYCRKTSLDATEEIYIDVNELAKGHDFTNLAAAKVSPDGKKLAYALDTQGRNLFTLHVIDIKSRKELIKPIENMTGNVVWAMDNATLFYTKQDLETLRSYQLYRQKLDGEAELVFEEKDETFRIGVSLTKSRKYIQLVSSSTLTTENHFLDAMKPEGPFKVFATRDRGHEYFVAHAGHEFYIISNDDARNFKIMTTSDQNWDRSQWQEWYPHREDTLVEDVEVFASHIVIEETKNGLNWLRVINRETKQEHVIDFGEQTWAVSLSGNYDYQTDKLRFVFESMHIPESVIDYHMITKEKELLKEQEIPSGYDKSLYKTERIFSEARDGEKIPVSIVYRKDIALDSKAPLLLYAYGSYGYSMSPWFSTSRISLLDRGFIYAIAHIRGGSEMGRHWYDDGKLLKKKNTFFDFIDVGKDLVKRKYTAHDRMYASGGSAGGLLVGSVINMAPEVFHGAIAEVPFVDVVTTMLDDSIPLTTAEYDEWGNPNIKEFYDYMLSYSPYDNVTAQDYPHLFVATGFHDSQVQYWEPAKWIAKLREMKTNNNQLLFKTNFDAGHGGASGRFESLKETATIWAFLLNLAEKV